MRHNQLHPTAKNQETIEVGSKSLVRNMERIANTLIIALLLCLHCTVVAFAQTGCTNATLQSEPKGIVKEVYQLAPQFVEQTGATKPVGAFYQQSFAINVEPGRQVVVSGSQDGRLGICTDDEARISVTTTGLAWSHQFANAIGTRIVPIAPVDITSLFTIGTNEIVISLTDLKEPAYSSSPFYLVLIELPATLTPTEPPISENTPTPIPATHTATAMPTVTPGESATETETSTLLPTQTTKPLPTHTPVAGVTATNPATPTAIMTVTAVSSTSSPATGPICCGALWTQISGLATSPFALALAVACIAILWLFWRFLNQPRLPGLLQVENLDNGSSEIISLRKFGTKVSIGPEGQIQLAGEELPAVVGRIVAKREEGTVGVFWQAEEIKQSEDQAIEELRHGSVMQIGHYRLTYENLADVTDDSELLDGGIWNEQEWA